MKTFDFKLDRFQVDQFFKAIRSKDDVIVIWMRAIKLMAAYVEPNQGMTAGSLKLRVSKMSRLFLSTDNKTYSINFPFFVEFEEGEFHFSTQTCSVIDSRISSEVLALTLTHSVLSIDDIYSFIDPFSASSEIDVSIWSLYRMLMICDDGYVRFDHDKELEDGDVHPLNHIDVFYSNRTKFKMGLLKKVSVEEFSDLLDIETDCHFLGKKSGRS